MRKKIIILFLILSCISPVAFAYTNQQISFYKFIFKAIGINAFAINRIETLLNKIVTAKMAEDHKLPTNVTSSIKQSPPLNNSKSDDVPKIEKTVHEVIDNSNKDKQIPVIKDTEATRPQDEKMDQVTVVYPPGPIAVSAFTIPIPVKDTPKPIINDQREVVTNYSEEYAKALITNTTSRNVERSAVDINLIELEIETTDKSANFETIVFRTEDQDIEKKIRNARIYDGDVLLTSANITNPIPEVKYFSFPINLTVQANTRKVLKLKVDITDDAFGTIQLFFSGIHSKPGVRLTIDHPSSFAGPKLTPISNIDKTNVDIGLSTSLLTTRIDRSSDIAFSPGTNLNGISSEDFNWETKFRIPPTAEGIRYITIKIPYGGLWSTAKQWSVGPLVVFYDNKQLNYKYDDIIKNIPTGKEISLYLYGQTGGYPFNSGTIEILFTDGTLVTGSISVPGKAITSLPDKSPKDQEPGSTPVIEDYKMPSYKGGPFSVSNLSKDTINSANLSLLSTTIDRAGAWDTFSPGASNPYSANEDYNWRLDIDLINATSTKNIQYLFMQRDNSKEEWSTAHINSYDYDTAYPLVVVDEAGQQLNNKYGDILGPFEPGKVHKFTLYAQKSSSGYKGSVLTIVFTDGTYLTCSYKI